MDESSSHDGWPTCPKCGWQWNPVFKHVCEGVTIEPEAALEVPVYWVYGSYPYHTADGKDVTITDSWWKATLEEAQEQYAQFLEVHPDGGASLYRHTYTVKPSELSQWTVGWYYDTWEGEFKEELLKWA